MKTLHTILIGATALAMYAYNKANNTVTEAKNIIDNLKVKVKKINNITQGFGKLTINLDIALINQTNHNFEANFGDTATLKKLELYTNTGVLLATANKEVSNLNLQPYTETVIQNVNVDIDTSNIVSTITQILSLTPENIVVQAHVQVLGKNFVI
ncbi:hypothetical protein [Mesoflavibacter sp. CH_XMU1404-2]|uniref:hypothetical protein n=1 Tax=Mesoflavibacter sp. CH_XMU1404-2 TaxID=3107766 RepID=UPI003009DCA9